MGLLKVVHRGWDDFPLQQEDHSEEDEKVSGTNHPHFAGGRSRGRGGAGAPGAQGECF